MILSMQLDFIKNEINALRRTKFGVSIPDLRKLARRIAKGNYKEFFEVNDCSLFEHRLLQAFVIGYIKDDIEIILKYFEDFIPYVNDWAVNDSLCQNFQIARIQQERVWDFLMKYKNSDKEFESRIVAVLLLSHYLNNTYIDKVISVLNNLSTTAYYSQMGVAWAIATIMGKYPEKCLEYLNSNNCSLDKITYNKALQKIRESYRVSEDVKLLTKKMKKL